MKALTNFSRTSLVSSEQLEKDRIILKISGKTPLIDKKKPDILKQILFLTARVSEKVDSQKSTPDVEIELMRSP
jgi:hypothetical protein